MKINKFYIALLLGAGIPLQGCKDNNFLDVPSRERVEADDSESPYTPEQFVNGIYGMFTEWDYSFSFLGITEIISDNADKGSSSTDAGGDKLLLDNLTYTSTAGSFEALWKRWYKSIGRATQAIEFIEKAELTDAAYKNRLIGEARFLRALNYFYLVRGWGDIPIQERDIIKRESASEVYDILVRLKKHFRGGRSLLKAGFAPDLVRREAPRLIAHHEEYREADKSDFALQGCSGMKFEVGEPEAIVT